MWEDMETFSENGIDISFLQMGLSNRQGRTVLSRSQSVLEISMKSLVVRGPFIGLLFMCRFG